MKKKLLLYVSVFAAVLLPLFASCDAGLPLGNPGDGETETESASGEVEYEDGDTGENPWGTLTIRTLDNTALSRSVSGMKITDISGGGIRDYYELIAVDEREPAVIWDYDSYAGTGELDLSIRIRKNSTYHLLLLTGHDSGTSGKTLLAAGYLRQTMNDASNNVIIPITPLVIDTAIVSKDGSQTLNPSGNAFAPLGLTEGGDYRLRVRIGSSVISQEGMNNTSTVSGDGLKALKDAALAVTATLEYWGKIKLAESKGFYAIDGGATTTVANTDETSGEELYDFSDAELTTGDTAAAWFNIKYFPFGMDSAAAWTAAPSSAGAARPLETVTPPSWVIRNGLDDAKQTALYGGAGFNGALALNVIAAPTYGAISDLDLSNFIDIPVTDEKPSPAQNYVFNSANNQWSGTVQWVNVTDNVNMQPGEEFDLDKVYMAKLSLDVIGSFRFNTSYSFTYNDGTAAYTDAGTGTPAVKKITTAYTGNIKAVVDITFPATGYGEVVVN